MFRTLSIEPLNYLPYKLKDLALNPNRKYVLLTRTPEHSHTFKAKAQLEQSAPHRCLAMSPPSAPLGGPVVILSKSVIFAMRLVLLTQNTFAEY
jgi:hypothetical protein